MARVQDVSIPKVDPIQPKMTSKSLKYCRTNKRYRVRNKTKQEARQEQE